MTLNTGTLVVAGVKPRDSADGYPTHYARYGFGGFREVDTVGALDDITADRRAEGMVVLVRSNKNLYLLDADLNTWLRMGPSAAVTAFGAIGDDTTICDTAFAAAAAAGVPIFLPDGTYKLGEPLLLSVEGHMVYGVGAASRIHWVGGGSTPVIAQPNYATIDSAGLDKLRLKNIFIDDSGTTDRTTYWTVDLTNGDYARVDNVEIDGNFVGSLTSDLVGLATGLKEGSAYTGTTWVTRVKGCTFRRAKVFINTTDWLFQQNDCYGFSRDYALRIGGGGLIVGNHIASGAVYGGVYVSNPAGNVIAGVKISSNNFAAPTGSPPVNSKKGIYAPVAQEVRQFVIGLNQFRVYDEEFIRLENAFRCAIVANTFRQGDADDTGEPDVYISGDANNITGNTFFRGQTAPHNSDNPRVNLGAPLEMVQVENVGSASCVTCNVVDDDSADYLDASYTGTNIISNNNSPHFRYNRTALPGIAARRIQGNHIEFSGRPYFYSDDAVVPLFDQTVASLATSQTLTIAHQVLLLSASAGNRTYTLPLSTDYPAGSTGVLLMRRTDNSGNTLTIDTQGGETINGSATTTIAGNTALRLVSDGAGAWFSV